MVIVDTKLSQSTKLTSGQQAAWNNTGGKLNYKPSNIIDQDIDGFELPQGIVQDTEITLSGFFKVFGDGDASFLNVE